LGTLTAVVGFGSSDALAGAFGIAVSLLMAITTLLATFVALHWKHNPWIVATMNGSLLAIDLLFCASTSTKLLDGGWFPLLIAFSISFLMLTWRKGQQIMDSVRLTLRQSSQQFIASLRADPPTRLPGTAVVLGRMAQGVPLPLTQNIKHNRVLHEHVLLVAAHVTEAPRVPDAERAVVTPLGEGITRVELRFGFMEQQNIPQGLNTAVAQGKIELGDPAEVTYFAGHETIIPLGQNRQMARWRESIFALMHANAQRPGAYFRIPCAQLMEIGVEFEI
jgi:KUP system potassium uptake protein